MGCGASKSKSPTTTDAAGPNGELIPVDPDLGWRRFVPHDYGDEETRIYPNSGRWATRLYNERSGDFYNVSVCVLAINISYRAAQLAENFGVAAEVLEPLKPENAPDPKTKTLVYRALHVPDQGWRLVRRKVTYKTPRGDPRFVQEVRRDNGKSSLADVVEIAANIGEQLTRLERNTTSPHSLPTNAFGWKVTEMREDLLVAVSSPEGEAFWVVPEELILDVADWVQTTYLTQAML